MTDLNTLLTAPALTAPTLTAPAPVAASTVIVSQPARQPPPDPADAPAEPSVFVAATEPAVPETNSGPQVPTANQSAALSAVKNVEQADRVVRVSAESLTRLVGLAGESLVETRQLRPFVDALLNLRATQVELCDTLAVLEDKSKLENAALSASFISMLTRVRERSDECLSSLTKQADNFESFARRNEDLSGRLHHEVIVSRMRPLADGIRGFPRLVRDVARSLDKQVRWETRGEQTGVDRDILDKLESPLSHLVRNALDHGIESPSQREAAGKTATGVIRLDARHRAGMLQITLTDDGRGIDIQQLRNKAVGRGLVAKQVAEQLSEIELLEFLFLPGFSTKEW